MKYLIVVLVFVMGAITIGEARWCINCTANSGVDCDGESVECENEGDFCQKATSIRSVYGQLRYQVIKGCKSVSGSCNKFVNANTNEFWLLLYSECCYDDNCNTGEIYMPKQNTTENGLNCPSSLVIGSDQCGTGNETVPCKGDQTVCFMFAADGTGPDKANYCMKGCISEGVCELPTDASTTSTTSRSCKPAQ
uniref:Sodefrin-like factor E n=1 Tax=Boana cinerascens TaxID=2364978 RepID=A0A513ZV95_9NEOB|nr:sodefrin precursor-like factor E [Boana cinerascens]